MDDDKRYKLSLIKKLHYYDDDEMIFKRNITEWAVV